MATTLKLNKQALTDALTVALETKRKEWAQAVADKATYELHKEALRSKHSEAQDAWKLKVIKLAVKGGGGAIFSLNTDNAYYMNRRVHEGHYTQEILIDEALRAEWPGPFIEQQFDIGGLQQEVAELEVMLKTLALVDGDTVSSSTVMKFQKYL